MGFISDLGESVVNFVSGSGFHSNESLENKARSKAEEEAKQRARKALLDAEVSSYSAGGKGKLENARRRGVMTNAVAANSAPLVNFSETFGGKSSSLGKSV